jgi:hypothetical protein
MLKFKYFGCHVGNVAMNLKYIPLCSCFAPIYFLYDIALLIVDGFGPQFRYQ